MVKESISPKKNIGHLDIFNICPILGIIVSDNLVVRFDFTLDKSRTKSDNYLYVNYLREQNHN